MAGAKLGFSLGDLQKGAKSLQETEVAERHESKATAAEREEGIASLEEVYNRHDGDLDKIFAELKANPTKAKKAHNMPKSANEFARKYYDGFYTLAEDADTAADSKSSHK